MRVRHRNEHARALQEAHRGLTGVVSPDVPITHRRSAARGSLVIKPESNHDSRSTRPPQEWNRASCRVDAEAQSRDPAGPPEPYQRALLGFPGNVTLRRNPFYQGPSPTFGQPYSSVYLPRCPRLG